MPTSPMKGVIKHLRRAALLPDGAGQSDGQLLSWFIERRDEAAFEALVRRHGPMVMSVCSRILSHHQDAEDAFQATFLVLARKAASITPPERVANWLHGVAYHTALKAKAFRAKRSKREKQVMLLPEPEAPKQDLWQELRPLLDQELTRLPEKYRLPIILCDLEEKPIKEAACHLGWPQGTLAGRLARGRTMLAKRLTRHIPAISGGALAAVLFENAAPASLPPFLVRSTVKAATLCAAGQAMLVGMVSGKVAALTEGVVVSMVLNKLKTLSLVLIGLVLVAFGGRVAVTSATAEAPADSDGTNSKKPLLAVPAPTKSAGKMAGKHLVINTELAELDENGSTDIITRPQILTLEDQEAQINIGADAASLYPNLADECRRLTFGPSVKLKVKHVDASKVRVDLAATTFKVEKAENADSVILATSIRAVREVDLGKQSRFVLAHDPQGEPQLWFDLTVNEEELPPGVVAPPRKAPPPKQNPDNTESPWLFTP